MIYVIFITINKENELIGLIEKEDFDDISGLDP